MIARVYLAQGEIENPKLSLMKPTGKKKGQKLEYNGTVSLETSGRLGHTIRILPRNEDLENPNQPGLVAWAGSDS